jgi:LPS-assembly lipoprotein
VRLGLAFALALLTAGCFQPLYGDRTAIGGAGIGDKLSGVEVEPIDTLNGSRLARVGSELHNELIYELTGGAGGASPTHKLVIKLSSRQLQVIVDINTARPDIQNYGIDASYTLVELATGKTVVNGQTFSRVSYNIPGQQQRFAGARGLRDAENRAAKVIAENIRSRLASYFVAGT